MLEELWQGYAHRTAQHRKKAGFSMLEAEFKSAITTAYHTDSIIEFNYSCICKYLHKIVLLRCSAVA
jgi:hypothetical protein